MATVTVTGPMERERFVTDRSLQFIAKIAAAADREALLARNYVNNNDNYKEVL